MTVIVSIWLALALGVSAALKARDSGRAGEALATYGIGGAAARRVGVWALVTGEAIVALALAAGFGAARWAATGLFLAFAAATGIALLAGRAGRPCACFGAGSRLGWASPARALALALLAGVVALGWLPTAPAGYARWLTLGLSLSIAATVALAVAVLALAREVGVVRLAQGERGALEIPQEGPELGVAQAWSEAVPRRSGSVLLLAVFSSEGCPLCRRVAPVVAHVAGDPLLSVRTFDEQVDAGVWAQAGVPGSPYAVALSVEGVALAKGTFNSLSQLESVLATARRRERMVPIAA
jgi:hypothetical protein